MGLSSDWSHLVDFIARHRREPLALATLVACEGSSYRQPGARLLVNRQGDFSGSLSGGCLEEGLARVAQKVLADGKTRTERIDTKPHFGCPGVLTILIESIAPDGLFETIIDSLATRQTLTLTTSSTGTSLTPGAGHTETITPPPRLIVVGWTSDQDPLFQMAQLLNWECHRILKDPVMRKSFPQIANEHLSHCPPEDLTREFIPDSSTAVLIMSHHLASDLSFLRAAAQAGYPYLGLLGSRRRRETLLNELGDYGLLEENTWLQNLHAPVGLDLGAEHPSTIALAILAEIQAIFAKKGAGFLSRKQEPAPQSSSS